MYLRRNVSNDATEGPHTHQLRCKRACMFYAHVYAHCRHICGSDPPPGFRHISHQIGLE